MRIPFYTLVICLVITSEVKSQCQIPNGSFEQWQDITGELSDELGIPLKFPVSAPEGWLPNQRPLDLQMKEEFTLMLGNDSLDLDVFAGLRRVSPGADGTESALLLGGDQYGFVSDVETSFDCTTRPDRVTGYFKYLSELEHDSLNVRVLLQSGSNTSQADAIGIATFTAFGGPPEFFKFSADFIYFNSQIPDRAIVSVTSGRYISWPEDTTYYIVDEIALEGGNSTTSVNDQIAYEQTLLVPNPVFDRVSLLEAHQPGSILKIYDSLGALLHRVDGAEAGEIDLSFLSPGMYLTRLENKKEILTQKIVKL
jgi:hypothetical protein